MKMKRFSLMLAALAGMVGLAYADVTYNPEAKLITDVTQLSTNCLWTDEYGLDKTLDGDLVSPFHSDAAEGRVLLCAKRDHKGCVVKADGKRQGILCMYAGKYSDNA